MEWIVTTIRRIEIGLNSKGLLSRINRIQGSHFTTKISKETACSRTTNNTEREEPVLGYYIIGGSYLHKWDFNQS